MKENDKIYEEIYIGDLIKSNSSLVPKPAEESKSESQARFKGFLQWIKEESKKAKSL